MWEVEDGGALWHETRGTGPFDTTMTVSSDNNGELLDPKHGADKRLGATTQCLHFDDPNATVTLTATPQAGRSVTWSGACTGTGATCTLTMDADKTVGAEFSK
jgi:hypothetical protein